MLAAALHDMSQAWDVGYYHLPFAGRLVGILPPGKYVFSNANAARFEGFTLLGEFLQGLLWRTTGRPEDVNLVAFACVPTLAWLGARRLGIPWHVTTLSLLAIPLVHAHSTSAYVDLPGNSALTVLVLLVIEAHASEGLPNRRTLALAALCAAAAANIKPMLQPIVALALAFFVARFLGETRRKEERRTAWWLLPALPLIFATPLKNLVLYRNPYFPLRIHLFGRALSGTEDAYSSSPAWLAHSPRPWRFFCSLLELGVRPLSDPRRWTIDQWAPSDSPGYRMGGFFHLYVCAHLGLLLWRVSIDRSRATRITAAAVGTLTLALSLMPQSHELRYYMAWMMVLVLSNLWLATRGVVPRGQRCFAPGHGIMSALAVAALAAVLAVTRGVYAYPSGSGFEDVVRAKVDEKLVQRIANGERVCVNREPFDVLWAPAFHPERTYVLKEAEEPSDCNGFRPLE
jgi:hypothetical protein